MELMSANEYSSTSDMKRETGASPVRSRRCDKRVSYGYHCFSMSEHAKRNASDGKEMGRDKTR